MTEKARTWRSTTTTRSHYFGRAAPNEEGGRIAAGDAGQLSRSEEWRYSSRGEDGRYEVEIKNGAVTVNGRRYDSMDEVPARDRERIEALRSGLADSDMWDLLKQAGADIEALKESMGQGAADQSGASNVADASEAGKVMPSAGAKSRSGADTTAAAAAPGEVPRVGGGLRRILIIVIAAGLAWVALRMAGVA